MQDGDVRCCFGSQRRRRPRPARRRSRVPTPRAYPAAARPGGVSRRNFLSPVAPSSSRDARPNPHPLVASRRRRLVRRRFCWAGSVAPASARAARRAPPRRRLGSSARSRESGLAARESRPRFFLEILDPRAAALTGLVALGFRVFVLVRRRGARPFVSSRCVTLSLPPGVPSARRAARAVSLALAVSALRAPSRAWAGLAGPGRRPASWRPRPAAPPRPVAALVRSPPRLPLRAVPRPRSRRRPPAASARRGRRLARTGASGPGAVRPPPRRTGVPPSSPVRAGVARPPPAWRLRTYHTQTRTARSAFTTTSPRARYSSRNRSRNVWSPLSASIAAYCEIELVCDVVWP